MSTKRLPLAPRAIIKLLKENGFQLDHITGSHYIFYHPVNKKRASVPYHPRELPKGTVRNILREAEIELSE